ncbi:hypothetical protein BUE80_DR003396 [Diplocarpon rosae]|nr:hypothetical protein BUE80_DR003396 [Diplocarpon rosae]
MRAIANAMGRFFLHIYKTLLNRHSFLGLLRHILINMTFILIWITTFKNAWRIDSSIRPEIHVKDLEEADHIIFDITFPGLAIQCILSLLGYSWMYALTRRSKLSILAAVPPFALNILHAATHTLCGPLDVFAWLSYGVIHFISPFLAAFWLWLFASPGVVSIFAWCFGIQNCLGIITHLSMPTAAPWYGDQYGYPLPAGNYSMPGSAAGLVRVDAVLGTHIYANAFKASPLVFGAFPSLHGAFSCCCFLFIARYSRRGAYMLGFYVLWQWFSTMYLRHHWRIDLLGGLIYSAAVFSIFYRSLQRIDKAYTTGVSGGNGWQRLFYGTRLQFWFARSPETSYEAVSLDDHGDGEFVRMSVDQAVRTHREEDLESAWVEDMGGTWKTRDPTEIDINSDSSPPYQTPATDFSFRPPGSLQHTFTLSSAQTDEMRPILSRARSRTRQAYERAFSISQPCESVQPAPPTNHQPLARKTSLITGASRGIGAEIARRFAREGVRCILAGRNETLLQAVKQDLERVGGEGQQQQQQQQHRILVGDVADGAFWEGVKREKHIDVLVNAAGVTHYSPLFVTSAGLLEEVVRTNLVGTMMACRTVGKNMMARKGGCIINVASLLGVKGGKGSSAYAASKAGVIGLTRALAAELGEKRVRVNVILPGYIETDMTEAMTPEARSNALNSIPLGRFGQAAEIADAAVFLATNKYASNCVLNLDGGLSA